MPDLFAMTVTLLQAPKPDKQFKSATGNATAHSGQGGAPAGYVGSVPGELFGSKGLRLDGFDHRATSNNDGAFFWTSARLEDHWC